MKRWEQPLVTLQYVPYYPEIMVRTSLCIGARWKVNVPKPYPVRVYSRDMTPLTDALLLHVADTRFARLATEIPSGA